MFALDLSLFFYSCEDKEKAEKVKKASERISTASAELITCANRVAEEGGEEEGGGREREEGGGAEEANPQLLDDLHETLEKTELLRRDWAAQVCTYLDYRLF